MGLAGWFGVENGELGKLGRSDGVQNRGSRTPSDLCNFLMNFGVKILDPVQVTKIEFVELGNETHIFVLSASLRIE